MTTTKRRNPRSTLGLLKGTVIVGGMMATMVGTNLLARRDLQASATVMAEPANGGSAIVQPLPDNQSSAEFVEPLPSLLTEPVWQNVLKPIPTVVVPGDVMPTEGISETASVTVERQFDPIPDVAAPATVSQPSASIISSAEVNQVLSFDLSEIPSVVIPEPVTNSRSSR